MTLDEIDAKMEHWHNFGRAPDVYWFKNAMRFLLNRYDELEIRIAEIEAEGFKRGMEEAAEIVDLEDAFIARILRAAIEKKEKVGWIEK